MLELSGVTKVYEGTARVVAVDGVTLSVARRERVAVMGPAGSGTSTLLHLMGGLDVPTSGTVRVGGTDLSARGETERSLFRRTHVAYVFQAYHLMPTLTAAQNAALPLHLAGVPPREVEPRVAAALVDVGLTGRAGHLPDELSGGERQRVAIARALVTAAPLLLADEPTGNLDSARGAEILALLRGLHEARGTTVVMVTHDPKAASVCDRVVTIRDGKLESDGRP